MLLGLDGLDPFEIRLITSKFSLIDVYKQKEKEKINGKMGWMGKDMAQVDEIELIPNSAHTEFPVSSGHVSAMEGILCGRHQIFTLIFTALQKMIKSSVWASSA